VPTVRRDHTAHVGPALGGICRDCDCLWRPTGGEVVADDRPDAQVIPLHERRRLDTGTDGERDEIDRALRMFDNHEPPRPHPAEPDDARRFAGTIPSGWISAGQPEVEVLVVEWTEDQATIAFRLGRSYGRPVTLRRTR
jgi:hypothetical protein